MADPWDRDGRSRIERTWSTVPWVEPPSEAAYYEAIARGDLTANQAAERRARMLAWWRRNDEARRAPSESCDCSTWSDLGRANLAALLEMLTETGGGHVQASTRLNGCSTSPDLTVRFPAMRELTAVFQKVPLGYIGFVEELPGANTQGATLEEARANLAEAVQLVLEANRALAEEELAGQDVIREPLRLPE